MRDLESKAIELLALCKDKGVRLATAESCTGGGIAAALTDIPGSSAAFERGFVTYSNEAKEELLSVPKTLIDVEGAVSEAVARAMAEGALAHSHADLAVSVTGVAGPDGGTEAKPVGLVHFAVAQRHGATGHRERRFDPLLGREGIRRESAIVALNFLIETARTLPGRQAE
ncbi:CinA family protein [Afifella marina]|uniref:Nicotinamide-nucleotide amidase n=1 Tax=Afifella marina DSM 2698 TaxID=1120955 RepID=A0A1G5NIG3_AFIMA|nr:CinA family protein [Afifella marina]MBK1623521.1 CinA family protein [Afifella marina DSM 2698]MBK1626514.1 CinA family protein [Afifella marina]MBK5916063.1 damage-inducible protein CinA [Afifella marina]RAI18334.1 damage-inducible protein CinA [Afifella marina DSM 2698]SCZ36964.1 nicotinamide-nucleotide amidase [Afifella marina DSM 2698]